MFSLSLIVGNTSIALMYTDAAKAKAAYDTIGTMAMGQTFELTDDFGQAITMQRSSIHAHLLEDLNKTKIAHVERLHFNDVVRAEAMKRAQTNQTTREAFRPPSPIIGMPGIPVARR